MKINNYSFEDISIGMQEDFTRTITEHDVVTFAALSGDHNPLHLDAEYAKKTPFKQRLVHGMLFGSLCSTLVGMHLPGKKCLYLSQTLVFRNPVFINDTVHVQGEVIAKSDSTRLITIEITITTRDKVAVTGTAVVKLI